ncbi:MAG: DUF87 domain-containing protein [Caldilineaceae bacterium]
MIDQPLALQALQAVDFDWTMHMQSVWRDAIHDVETLHQPYRQKILDELLRLQRSGEPNSPLGMILVGSAGSGKTHLLSALRRYALSHDISFVLVDMTDVHDFWTTVLQGYVDSLQEAEADGIPQFHKLLDFLIKETKVTFTRTHLAQAERRHVGWYIVEMLNALSKRYRREVIKHQDVIRALVLLNSDDFTVSNVGYSWLLGMGVSDQDSADFRFTVNQLTDPSKIVEGLSWLLSLRAPTLLAFDQLDSIVSQHYLAAGTSTEDELSDGQRVSRAIIEGISGGLLGLRDRTLRTLSLLSCLEETWRILSRKVASPVRGRFHAPMILGPILVQQTAEQIIGERLQTAYQQVGFTPRYTTWPYAPSFFAEAREHYPRLVLRRCHQHRENCLAQQRIVELKYIDDAPVLGATGSTSEFAEVEQALATAKSNVQVLSLLNEENEDDLLGPLMQFAGKCLLIENPTQESVDALLDTDFAGGKSTRPLHARLRLAYRDEGDREQHLSLRVLQRTNALAYQSRLKAAMNAAGIDRALDFRRLALIRTTDLPGGDKTRWLTNKFQDAGGLVLCPTEDELRTLGALLQVHRQNHSEWEAWLQQRRPVSQLSFLQPAVTWLFNGNVKEPLISPPPVIIPPDPSGNDDIGIVVPHKLPIGRQLISGKPHNEITIPTEELTKHTVILAGSGSGKTVLVKRLVEEAALLGIPSIVIDGANDLARLGDPWPASPESWLPDDAAKAHAYHAQSQVVVWTPGIEQGNPLNLEPLPDLAAVAGNPSELDQAIDMACDALEEIVASGTSHTASLKRGILRSALTYFAHNGAGDLAAFVDLLADLPPTAGAEITQATKRSQEMADSLRAEMLVNPLLRQQGAVLDPALLFGVGVTTKQTRVSVINLAGLLGLNAQQQFLNQLAMTLFTWIKKHPAPADAPIRGLLVIDEAKDFVPSLGSTPCKANLLRLVAQARKYGLGLIFATQAPKSIDHNIIANCTIQFYGRANSPAAIEVVQEQLRLRGGTGQDIARLERGQFYAATESLNPPVKVQAPLCLSHHAATPLDESEVIKRAIRVGN